MEEWPCGHVRKINGYSSHISLKFSYYQFESIHKFLNSSAHSGILIRDGSTRNQHEPWKSEALPQWQMFIPLKFKSDIPCHPVAL